MKLSDLPLLQRFFITTGIGQHHTTILSDCTGQHLTEANANVANMFNGLFIQETAHAFH